jgi:hypothetical protein
MIYEASFNGHIAHWGILWFDVDSELIVIIYRAVYYVYAAGWLSYCNAVSAHHVYVGVLDSDVV